MAKTATLKSANVLGKDMTVMDSMTNIKKINAGMKAIYKRIDSLDEKDENTTFADYNEVITDEVVKQVAKLLDLNKEDSKKLENMSYSDLFNFYSKAVNDFTGMNTPSVRAMQERMERAVKAATKEDPK
ncbi:hypothetical protein [Limosilactobacillus reuteri]|uniref:hypothetical protein n=1 Tax=Limosilactobacillus reuteri TaxID=1598 RepID=UPI002B0541E8|nr:hypothetical protein [Limosilactobacillus reuteri]